MDAPVFAIDRFLKGESKSIATMPMLKICTPPPDMYSINACIGSDLSGETANSQAFFVFRASCGLSACTADVADADADVVIADDLPGPLPYNWKEWGVAISSQFSPPFSHVRHGRRELSTHL